MLASLFLFGITFSAAFATGFVPYYVDGSAPTVSASSDFDVPVAYTISDSEIAAIAPLAEHPEMAVALSALPVLGEELAPVVAHAPIAEPSRLVIRSIGLDLPVGNPSTTNVASLDALLTKEVVRYPSSGKLGEVGNVLIFGHSSHLPVVHNQMYKAFNGLPDLSDGALIEVIGGGYTYTYQVTKIRKTDASEEVIDLSGNGGQKLTLSTCDTFGAKSSRWVVEANFVSAYPTPDATQ